MIYLDNAATTFPKPPEVEHAVMAAFHTIGNAGRGAHAATLDASRIIYGLISLVVSFAMEVLESLEQRTVHTSGLAHLLELPEYRSLERAQPLMSYLSEDADPARFPIPKDDPMKILIGPENVADALKDTSVVVASYDIGDGMRGVIGVVGPTRMDYAKITARLSYLAEGLSRLFGQGELPQGRDDEK